jgi:hypothetical protein
MNIHDPWNIAFSVLLVFSIAWTLKAYSNRHKPRWHQEGLSQWHSIGFLCAPSIVASICLALSAFFNLTPFLWLCVLGVLLILARYLSDYQADWIGVPLKIRQAANQIGWGVILCIAIMALIASISEMLGYQ